MRKLLLITLCLCSIAVKGQSYFPNPFNPCKEDTAFSLLAFQPVINGVPITDSSDVVIEGSDVEGAMPLPDSAVNGVLINLTYLEVDVKYGVKLTSMSQDTFVETAAFVIPDLAGTLSLMDNDPSVTTV